MIRYAERKYTKPEMLRLMQPLIGTWFDEKFESLTEPQSYAIPLIHERRNSLVSSPTGSGKTITAFLSIINELYSLQLRGELEPSTRDAALRTALHEPAFRTDALLQQFVPGHGEGVFLLTAEQLATAAKQLRTN